MADVKKSLRTVRNVVHNYNDAQVKVREATSNDPWGPAASLMADISDMTFNQLAFSDIMQMLWKRLNDNGKDWRHVYKALVVLDYIIKSGSEKVATHCKENLYFIQTLQNFQYVEELKDHGMNVREKAKQVVTLLTDDERLKNERVKAHKTRERFHYSGAGGLHRDGSEGGLPGGGFPDVPSSNFSSISNSNIPSEMENVRPQTVNEEEIQLQIALAMSKEEAAEEERRRQRDDVRLQLAISESQNDYHKSKAKPVSSADELFDVFHQTPDIGQSSSKEPWDGPAWSAVPPSSTSAFSAKQPSLASAQLNDPWSSPSFSTSAPLAAPSFPVQSAMTLDPWSHLAPNTLSTTNTATISPNNLDGKQKRNPTEDFLGKNSGLVNLDALISVPARPTPTSSLLGSAFGIAGATVASPSNPFHQAATPAPTINQLRRPAATSPANAFLPVSAGQIQPTILHPTGNPNFHQQPQDDNNYNPFL